VDSVFGIRFFAVLFSAGVGWQLFRLARRLYDDRTALWCLLLALVMPLFAVGSILMTIDPLSVFFWAWGANLFWTALESRKMVHWIGLGLVIGLGFLAKFTNGLQLGCVALFLLWSKPHRALFLAAKPSRCAAPFCSPSCPLFIGICKPAGSMARLCIRAAGLRNRLPFVPPSFSNSSVENWP
jgi:4-amino-4-deoxy-L-arabinose transferase-like glycosyltransferase